MLSVMNYQQCRLLALHTWRLSLTFVSLSMGPVGMSCLGVGKPGMPGILAMLASISANPADVVVYVMTLLDLCSHRLIQQLAVDCCAARAAACATRIS